LRGRSNGATGARAGFSALYRLLQPRPSPGSLGRRVSGCATGTTVPPTEGMMVVLDPGRIWFLPGGANPQGLCERCLRGY
jgi:hypothetical protein